MTQRQSRRRRARRRRKHGFSTWSLGKKILLVFVIALLLMITVGVVYAADKLGKLEQTKLDTKKLSISDEIDLGDGYTNLALFGLDSRDGELGEGVRSDSIIIASTWRTARTTTAPPPIRRSRPSSTSPNSRSARYAPH